MKVLVCDTIARNGIERLKAAGFVICEKTRMSLEELKKIIGDYQVIIVRGRTKVTEEVIEKAEELQIIARVGVGLDNIAEKAAKEKGIAVLNTPEAPADAVAELTIGLIIALARKIPFANRSTKRGEWLKKELKGLQLKGRTLGIIGLGKIGLRVARIARSMGMRILVTKRKKPRQDILEELEAEFVPLSNLLEFSDVVTIHIPLNKDTYKLIDGEKIKKMKDGSFLVNTSRGGIIDQKSLYEALKSGKIGGAALDVYANEPPKDSNLIRLPNVVCTPHIGAQTEKAQDLASSMIAEKIIDFYCR